MRSPRTAKLHLPSRVARICRMSSFSSVCGVPFGTLDIEVDQIVHDVSPQIARPTESSTPAACRLRLQAGNELATIFAAGCGCLVSATLCPAHNETASISPVVPTSGAAVAYRIGSPEAKCAMTPWATATFG